VASIGTDRHDEAGDLGMSHPASSLVTGGAEATASPFSALARRRRVAEVLAPAVLQGPGEICARRER
jgi:hypothetical protein